MAPAPQPKPGAGKPGGLPAWAWVAAAGVGLIIGLFVFRDRPAAASSNESGGGAAAGTSTDGSGGVVALPPELLAALGLRPGDSIEGGESVGEATSEPTYAEGSGTNAQLPSNLQVAGLAPDAPVISSYFDRSTTISAGPISYQPVNVQPVSVQQPSLGGGGSTQFKPL